MYNVLQQKNKLARFAHNLPRASESNDKVVRLE
jgi:hypothetical protein